MIGRYTKDAQFRVHANNLAPDIMLSTFKLQLISPTSNLGGVLGSNAVRMHLLTGYMPRQQSSCHIRSPPSQEHYQLHSSQPQETAEASHSKKFGVSFQKYGSKHVANCNCPSCPSCNSSDLLPLPRCQCNSCYQLLVLRAQQVTSA